MQLVIVTRLVLLAILFSPFVGAIQAAENETPRVFIADPYIELRTGPGRAYPVFYVEERGEAIDILRRRTDWLEVKTSRGQRGWVHVDQLAQTLLENGQPVKVKNTELDDYLNRKREIGTLLGEFGGASMMSVYGNYRFTPNISTELSIGQVIGDISNILLLDVNVLQQPFPEWKLSPFFSLGTGSIQIKPAATLVQSEDRTDRTLNVGVGAWYYFSQNFMLRAEYRRYTILTSRNDNDEESQWKAGLSVFF